MWWVFSGCWPTTTMECRRGAGEGEGVWLGGGALSQRFLFLYSTLFMSGLT